MRSASAAFVFVGMLVAYAATAVAAEKSATVTAAEDKKKEKKGTGRIDGDDLVLEKLVVLNRHGHRAPNAPFWTLCPTEAARGNADKFGTGPEDLTDLGFDEEYRCGVYIRDMYPDVVGKEYNRRSHFIQATGEPRTLQSAMAISNGAFPVTKRTPSGGLPHHPNLIPVYSANQNREYFLNDIPCKDATDKAVKAFLEKGGEQIYDENKKLLKHVLDLCGTTDDAAKAVSMDLLVKLVVDGIIFENDYGIEPLKGKLSTKDFMALRNVSNAFLFGKLYGTDAQRTFTAGEFPHFLVKTFDFLDNRTVNNSWNDNQLLAITTPLNIFVVHREEIYGMAFFFDWQYSASGMAEGEVPAGTAFIFEYLLEKSTKTRFLRIKMWNPREGEVAVKTHCQLSHMCTEAELRDEYLKRVRRTGRWDALCDFPRPDRWFASR